MKEIKNRATFGFSCLRHFPGVFLIGIEWGTTDYWKPWIELNLVLWTIQIGWLYD